MEYKKRRNISSIDGKFGLLPPMNFTLGPDQFKRHEEEEASINPLVAEAEAIENVTLVIDRHPKFDQHALTAGRETQKFYSNDHSPFATSPQPNERTSEK